MVVEIIAKTSMKKGIMVIKSISLKQTETVRKKFDQSLMEKTISACKSTDIIEDKGLKSMLENLTFGIKELLQRSLGNESAIQATNDKMSVMQ